MIYDGYYNHFGLTQKEDIIKCFNTYDCRRTGLLLHQFKLEDITGNYNGTGFDWVTGRFCLYDMPFDLNLVMMPCGLVNGPFLM